MMFVIYFFVSLNYLVLFFKQLIQKEYFNLQVQSDRRIMEVDTELNDKRTKLQVYEKVEQELDEVVMQAAQGKRKRIQKK